MIALDREKPTDSAAEGWGDAGKVRIRLVEIHA
jgi:hypothetical protein